MNKNKIVEFDHSNYDMRIICSDLIELFAQTSLNTVMYLKPICIYSETGSPA